MEAKGMSIKEVLEHELMNEEALCSFSCYSDSMFCYTVSANISGYWFEICFIPHDDAETLLSKEGIKHLTSINHYFFSCKLFNEDLEEEETIYQYKQKTNYHLN